MGTGQLTTSSGQGQDVAPRGLTIHLPGWIRIPPPPLGRYAINWATIPPRSGSALERRQSAELDGRYRHNRHGRLAPRSGLARWPRPGLAITEL